MNILAFQQLLQSRATPSVQGNPIGKYGKADTLRIGDKLTIMRITEMRACLHLLRPDDAAFEPPAATPSKLICHQCKERKPHSAFSADVRNTNRDGRRSECKACNKIARKRAQMEQRLKS